MLPSTAFQELTLAQLWQGAYEHSDQQTAWGPTGDLKVMHVSKYR